MFIIFLLEDSATEVTFHVFIAKGFLDKALIGLPCLTAVMDINIIVIVCGGILFCHKVWMEEFISPNS